MEILTEHLLIDGHKIAALSGKYFESRNPATGDIIAMVAEGGPEDIDLAVRAARRAFEDGSWPRFLPDERQKILLRVADLLESKSEFFAQLDTRDMGAPIRHTRGAIPLLVGVLRYYAGLARDMTGDTIRPSIPDVFAATLREPIGVCGAIIPWNGPLWASVLKIAPVLASGCTLVLKPAEDAPLAPLAFGALCLEAGVPPGVINIVPGFGATAGAALAAHLDVDKISFTGSTTTGRKIIEASAGNLKRLSLELGGKSPNIIFADANLEAAVGGAMAAAFANSGQVCSAGSRLFVERSVFAEFTRELVIRVKGLKIGPGVDPSNDLGPLVSARQLARVAGYVDGARSDGATPLCGGQRLTGIEFDQGYFYPPTILTDLSDSMAVVREEIFGPVLCALPFDGELEVLKRANATAYGLGGAVWTRDLGRALRFAGGLKAGSVWVNCYNLLDPAVPSGGMKTSGYGREYGPQYLEEYFELKSLWINNQ
jgi:aldehyde dehydrogenase (NAD+)